MNVEERNQFVADVQEQVDIAKSALQKIVELSDGKDGNTAFLASYEIKNLEKLVKCANLN